MRFWLVVLLIVVSGCNTYSPDEVEQNQTSGNIIVAALAEYHTDNAHYPDALPDLVPTYLQELPQNSRDQMFYYAPDDVIEYRLCFDSPKELPNIKDGCCYLGRHELWDCTPGHD